AGKPVRLEPVRRTVVAHSVAVLRHVAFAAVRAALGGALQIRAARGAHSIAGIGGVADSGRRPAGLAVGAEETARGAARRAGAVGPAQVAVFTAVDGAVAAERRGR